MAEKTTLGTRASDDLHQRVEDYAEARGVKKSQAVKDLIRTGLRERQGPIRSAWRERVHEWSGLLAIFAMVVLSGGVVAPAYFEPAVQLSAVMLMLALALLGVVEGARLLTGQSWLAGRLLEVVGR